MNLNRIIASNLSFFTKLFVLLTGVFIGLTLSNWIHGAYDYSADTPCVMVRRTETQSNAIELERPRKLSDELDTQQLLFAGIMTAEKFLHSRASAVYNTWGKTVPGKLVFFAGNKSGNVRHSLPVVSLDGVDDRYPPQRKSFMMLKYMCDNYINDYEWFMRCDDDVYIRTDKLEELLRGFDSSEDIFLGQAGQGNPTERGQLGLGPDENFCMGGPGMIISRSALKKLAPHLEYCLRHLVSSHEDVEVGRCVRKHVGPACTWAFEMQWLFYHNRSRINAFHSDLDTKAVQSAITLHPIKNPSYMYRIHAHFFQQEILAVQHRAAMKTFLLHNLKKLTQVTLTKQELTMLKSKKDLHQHTLLNSTLHWELFSPKKLYSIASQPTVAVQHSIKRSLNLVLRRTLAQINLEARKVIFRELLLSKVNLGYIRLAPTQGLQFIFDFQMVMYTHIGFSRRKLPIPVQYQAHVQKPFGNLIYKSRTVERINQPYVNIILPLAGRLRSFKRFLSNIERTVLVRNEKVRLLIMYFPKSSNSRDHKRLLNSYTDTYSNFDVFWQTVKGDFSRALALQLGVNHFNPDSLLFFCDVDLVFDVEFLHRCRLNTRKGRKVYYPEVFSQFNQSFSVGKSYSQSLSDYKTRNSREEDGLKYENLQSDRGFWRIYGFGILCAYGEDVNKVGGFDLNIRGWGLEDVRLYEQFIASGRYDIIRSPDPGLVHIYHVSHCSPELEPSQSTACHASARSQLANAASLVNYMTKKDYL